MQTIYIIDDDDALKENLQNIFFKENIFKFKNKRMGWKCHISSSICSNRS